MKLKSGYWYLLLFALHVLIAMIAFLHFRLHPYDILFPTGNDGLKNLYTMVSYVKEPITADGLFKYNSFQYPIGEYIYYTDNTPWFSLPFRWFCLHIYNASGSTVVVFYSFLILNIIAGGMLLFYIFRALIIDNLLSFILALVLPWTNMQQITPVHGKMIIDMVGYGIIDPLIRGKLNNKPILVAVNTRIVTDSTLYNVPRDKGVREKNYWGCSTFVQRNGLSAIDSAGAIKYYEWYPLAGR